MQCGDRASPGGPISIWSHRSTRGKPFRAHPPEAALAAGTEGAPSINHPAPQARRPLCPLEASCSAHRHNKLWMIIEGRGAAQSSPNTVFRVPQPACYLELGTKQHEKVLAVDIPTLENGRECATYDSIANRTVLLEGNKLLGVRENFPRSATYFPPIKLNGSVRVHGKPTDIVGSCLQTKSKIMNNGIGNEEWKKFLDVLCQPGI